MDSIGEFMAEPITLEEYKKHVIITLKNKGINAESDKDGVSISLQHFGLSMWAEVDNEELTDYGLSGIEEEEIDDIRAEIA